MRRFAWMVANAVHVSLDCNDHRNSYRTAAQEFEDDDLEPPARNNFGDVDAAERAECIAKDSICQLYIYPNTPVGSVVFTHADPEVCVERGYRWLREQRGFKDEDEVAPGVVVETLAPGEEPKAFKPSHLETGAALLWNILSGQCASEGLNDEEKAWFDVESARSYSLERFDNAEPIPDTERNT